MYEDILGDHNCGNCWWSTGKKKSRKEGYIYCNYIGLEKLPTDYCYRWRERFNMGEKEDV